jgi:hypothetical protein
VVHN